MRSKQTFGVRFLIKKDKAVDGKAPIYARLTVNGKEVDIAARDSINPSDWGGPKLLATGRGTKTKAINDNLEELKNGLKNSYRELVAERKDLSADSVKKRFLGEDRQHRYSLCEAITRHFEEAKKDKLASGTIKNYYTTERKIQKFLYSQFHVADILLEKLNFEFVNGFYHYLINTPPEKPGDKICSHNGALKHIERLSKIINLVLKFGWLEKDPFALFQSSFTVNDIECLTDDELEVVCLKQFSAFRLQLVKDLFIFACYTGISYSDLMKLDQNSITTGIDGNKWVTYSRVKIKKKTVQTARIPLLPRALDVLNKYKNHPAAISRGKLFPCISNQKLNSYLKELADTCGIYKPLTFHIARHTFGTTVTLANGVPIETVSAMMLHSDLRMTQRYAKVVARKLNRDMANLRDQLVANAFKNALNTTTLSNKKKSLTPNKITANL